MQKKTDTIAVRGFAKINLFLDVTGRREDGYHLVNMAMQSLDLYDTLRIERTENHDPAVENPDQLTVVDPEGRFTALENDERNLVLRAARALRQRYPEVLKGTALTFTLEKRIPMGAGLAGGSTDAAAALIGIDRLFSMELSDEELADAALSLGADVPYCLRGGSMRAQGIGEILSPLPDLPDCGILLVKPEGSASTKEIYTALDGGQIDHPDWNAFEKCLAEKDLAGIADGLSNVLEPVCALLIADIPQIREELLAAGALGARMTGSGSVVFGIFADRKAAAAAGEKLRDEHPQWEIIAASPLSERTTEDLRVERGYWEPGRECRLNYHAVLFSLEDGTILQEQAGKDLICSCSQDESGLHFTFEESSTAGDDCISVLTICDDAADGCSAVCLERHGMHVTEFMFDAGGNCEVKIATPYGTVDLSAEAKELQVKKYRQQIELMIRYRMPDAPDEEHRLEYLVFLP